jgi:hypothetical protein
MGEASVDSCISDYINALCDDIGVRCAGTENERAAAEFVAARMAAYHLQNPSVEEFALQTADCHSASLTVVAEEAWTLDARPCLFYPSIDIEAPLVDVGYGMPHELKPLQDGLAGCVALIHSEFEPFTEPRVLTHRLHDLASTGAVAAITSSPHYGRRLTHSSASDWRDDATSVPLPLVQTSREDAVRLKDRAAARAQVVIRIHSVFRTTTSWNTLANLPGLQIPGESIVLGALHDATPDSFGANDNGAGVAVLLETARLLAGASNAVCLVRCRRTGTPGVHRIRRTLLRPQTKTTIHAGS